MIPFILMNWKWLAPTAAAVVLGVLLGITKLELSAERLARAEERTAAAKMQAEAVERNRVIEAKDAEYARNLDVERARAETEIAATRDDFERRLSVRLRERRPACPSSVSAAAATSGEPSAASPGGDVGYRGRTLATDIRDSVKRLQADVKECWAFAERHGR